MTRPMLEAMGIDRWIASRTPMRRVGEAEEVTNAVMFLASDLASYITGVDLLVDGGTNASNGTFKFHLSTTSGIPIPPWCPLLTSLCSQDPIGIKPLSKVFLACTTPYPMQKNNFSLSDGEKLCHGTPRYNSSAIGAMDCCVKNFRALGPWGFGDLGLWAYLFSLAVK